MKNTMPLSIFADALFCFDGLQNITEENGAAYFIAVDDDEIKYSKAPLMAEV